MMLPRGYNFTKLSTKTSLNVSIIRRMMAAIEGNNTISIPHQIGELGLRGKYFA